MMRSMYSGVAGLKTHQTRMDVIGNNIANVNTVAFKSQSVTFSELMYQTTQNASGPNATTGTGGINARQIGLGVKTGAINTNISSQGASQTTNNPFDIQITGDAFFIVSNGSETFFTRDGSFYVDGAGNLAMTSNGYNVMGWGVDPETMDIKMDNVAPLRIMAPENLTYPPEATTKAYLSGIIDKNDTNVTSSSGKNINLQFYDDLGYSYTARINLKSTDTEGKYYMSLQSILNENNEPIDLTDANGNKVANLFGGPVDVSRQQDVSLGDNFYWDADGLHEQGVADPVATIALLTSTDAADAADKAAAEAKLAEAYGVDSVEDLKNLKVSFQIDVADATGGGTHKEDITPAPSMFDIITNATITSGNANGENAGDLYMQVQNEILTAEGSPTYANYYEALESVTSTSQTGEGFIVNYDPTTGIFSGINGNNVNVVNLNLSGITVLMDNNQQESKFENIEIDLSTTTMFNNSGSSTIAATSGDTKGLGTGRKLGEMSGISIQNNGMIYASYDNGQTKLLGQIAVAEFANASGLEKEGDNLYAATLNSGEFDGIGVDITAGGGYMNTGVLEMSNVDLSAEFTEMITTQRGFQANSRIITVSDTLLEELVNLKR